MSMMLMAKAMSLKVGNSVRKLVLLKLADQANDKGECWPSYQSIAEAAECSRQTAVTHIEWLAAKGYLKIEKRTIGKGQNLTNVYHLTLEKGSQTAELGSQTAELGSQTTELGSQTTELGSQTAELGGSQTALPEPVNKNQSMNQSMNQYGSAHAGASAPDASVLPDQPDTLADDWDGNEPDLPAKPAKPKKRQPSAAALELAAYDLLADRGVDGQLAADYMALRKSKRAGPLTHTALAGIEREANLAGLSLTQAVTVCCERSWVGFKADWLLRDGDHHPPCAAKQLRQNSINRIPQHTNGGVHLAKDIL